MEKHGPLDGRKYNENNKDSQIGQVTTKKIFKKRKERERERKGKQTFLVYNHHHLFCKSPILQSKTIDVLLVCQCVYIIIRIRLPE